MSDRWSGRDTLHLGLLLLVVGLLFFTRLRAPLLEPQEGRYAELPRQMLARGEWLVPTYHGRPYLDKPPLFYWGVMASYQLFGVRDRTARLVPAVAAAATVVVVYWWGRRALGARPALLGGLILALTPEFVYRGRMLTFDAVLTPCVTAALAFAHVALLAPRVRWRWWALSAIACGLGLLVKGPVALALVLPVLAVAPRLAPLARPSLGALALYAAVACAVAAPWYLAVMLRQPEFAHYFFWRHNLERFVTPFDHAQPMWYYLPGLLAGLLPWALLLPGLARSVGEREGRAVHFPLIAFAWGLLFFSLAGCKRPTYLLPLFAPLALALGWQLDRRLSSFWQHDRLSLAAAALPLVAGMGAVGVGVALGFLTAPRGVLLGATLGLSLLLMLLLRYRVGWSGTIVSCGLCLVLAVGWLLPAYNRQFSLRSALRKQAAEARGPVVCYPQPFESLAFYLPDRPVRAFRRGQERALADYLRDHPGSLVVLKTGLAERALAELPTNCQFQGTATVALTVGVARTVD